MWSLDSKWQRIWKKVPVFPHHSAIHIVSLSWWFLFSLPTVQDIHLSENLLMISWAQLSHEHYFCSALNPVPSQVALRLIKTWPSVLIVLAPQVSTCAYVLCFQGFWYSAISTLHTNLFRVTSSSLDTEMASLVCMCTLLPWLHAVTSV